MSAGDPDDVAGAIHARLELLESVTETANRAGSLEEPSETVAEIEKTIPRPQPGRGGG